MIHPESARQTSREILGFEWLSGTWMISLLVSFPLWPLCLRLTEDTNPIFLALLVVKRQFPHKLAETRVFFQEVFRFLKFKLLGSDSDFQIWSCMCSPGNRGSAQSLFCSNKLWVCSKRCLWTSLSSKGLQRFFKVRLHWFGQHRVAQLTQWISGESSFWTQYIFGSGGFRLHLSSSAFWPGTLWEWESKGRARSWVWWRPASRPWYRSWLLLCSERETLWSISRGYVCYIGKQVFWGWRGEIIWRHWRRPCLLVRGRVGGERGRVHF